MGGENQKPLNLKDNTYVGVITLVLSIVGFKDVSPDIVNNIAELIGLMFSGGLGLYLIFKDGLVEHNPIIKQENLAETGVTEQPKHE